MMKKVLFPLACVATLMWGCDYVDVPQQAGGSVITPASDTVRRIFIEDFTGHFCPNCPAAARKIDSLSARYPQQIVSMAIHIEDFADPCPPHAPVQGMIPGSFTEDFRVPAEATDYDAAFQSNSFPLPSGFINRSQYPVNIRVDVADWPTRVALELAKPMTAYIKVTPTYNTTSRALSVSVAGKFMVDTTGTYKVALYLVEDSLTGSQSDNTLASPSIDNNYVFNEVFRGSINPPGSVLGATAVSGTITAGSGFIYNTTGSFTVNAAYNAAHCKVIAILYNASDYGILQAGEADLIP